MLDDIDRSIPHHIHPLARPAHVFLSSSLMDRLRFRFRSQGGLKQDNEPSYLNMVLGCGRWALLHSHSSSVTGLMGRLPRPMSPSCLWLTYIQSTWHIHGTSLTHSPITRLPNCTDCTSAVPFVPGPGNGWLAEWLAGAGLHSFVSIPYTLHPVRALLSAGAPSARVKRDRHTCYSISYLDRWSRIHAIHGRSIDTFRIIRCVIQEDYTIESHALPPSQPQPPAHGRRSEWNEPNACPPTTTRPASSQPQLIKQVPSGSQM